MLPAKKNERYVVCCFSPSGDFQFSIADLKYCGDFNEGLAQVALENKLNYDEMTNGLKLRRRVQVG